MDRIGAPVMIELLRSEIRTRYPGLGSVDGPQLLQIGGTNWRGGRIHFAVLDADGAPALFARTTRNPADESLLAHEHELLSALAASSFREHVCAPAFFARVGGRSVLCERAAGGRPMPAGRFPWKRARGFGRDVDIACDVAIALARATATDTDADELDRFALEPLVRFWVQAGGEPDAMAWLVERLHAVLGARARTVVVHGDFIPKNILIGPNERRVVVDWETAEPHGLPLLDLIYFVTRCAYVGAIAPTRTKAAAVRAFYASESAHAYVARSAMQRYCTALGLAPGLVDPVFRLHFLHKAMLKARTTSLDNPVTQLWLEMFRERLDPQDGPWPALAGAVAR